MEGDRSPRNWIKTATISIHALRVEGDFFTFKRSKLLSRISIHALRVEGDKSIADGVFVTSISIHALRVEGDL